MVMIPASSVTLISAPVMAGGGSVSEIFWVRLIFTKLPSASSVTTASITYFFSASRTSTSITFWQAVIYKLQRMIRFILWYIENFMGSEFEIIGYRRDVFEKSGLHGFCFIGIIFVVTEHDGVGVLPSVSIIKADGQL